MNHLRTAGRSMTDLEHVMDDDLKRLHAHELVHALACQLRDVSRVTVEISTKERNGNVLSSAERTLRESKRELAGRIEMLIRTMSGDFEAA
jgi:hypothetical protein